MRRINQFALALGLAGLTCAAQADWRAEISTSDVARLQQLDASRQKGLAEAHAGAGKGDFAAIAETLTPTAHTVPEAALLGNWRCRQMKLGGMTPYIVYSWFTCRIHRVGGGLFFEKVNGSQRTEGFLYPERGAWVYLGASSAPGEPPHRYSGNAASVGAAETPDDQVGILSGIGNNHLRLEMPAPVQESDFEAIELKR